MQSKSSVLEKDGRVVLDGDGFPRRITLELTNRCNLSCVFCPRRLMEKHQGFLELDLARKLIDEMAGNPPVTLVPFFRGEPLLHPHWYAILSYARERGIGPIQFTTNATLMDREAVEGILDLGLDFISFSMDTVDKELYERTRLRADYNKVLENILFLLDLKEKRSLEKPIVQVSAVETALHKEGMKDFVSFWKPKVDVVRVYVEHSKDGHPGSIDEKLPTFERREPCFKVFTDLVIYWDGEAGICNHDWIPAERTPIGNVREESIAEIWTSSRYSEIRSSHLDGDLANETPCDFCDHWKMYYLPDGFLGSCYKDDRRAQNLRRPR